MFYCCVDDGGKMVIHFGLICDVILSNSLVADDGGMKRGNICCFIEIFRALN